MLYDEKELLDLCKELNIDIMDGHGASTINGIELTDNMIKDIFSDSSIFNDYCCINISVSSVAEYASDEDFPEYSQFDSDDVVLFESNLTNEYFYENNDIHVSIQDKYTIEPSAA